MSSLMVGGNRQIWRRSVTDRLTSYGDVARAVDV